jgi:hypothetical protein
MYRFTRSVKKQLRKAGWHKKRAVSFEPIRLEMEKEGLTVFQAAEDFLTEFYGLEIPYAHDWGEGLITFNVSHVVGDTTAQWIKKSCEPVVGKPLCLIGRADQDRLLMAPDGRVYSVNWPDIIEVGESGEDFIEKTILFKGQYGKPIAP